MKAHEIVLAFSLLVLAAGDLAADELEDALSGFDDAPVDDLGDLDESGFDETESFEIDAAAKANSDPGYRLSGYVSVLSAHNTAQDSASVVATGDMPMDFSDLSRARFKGGLTLELKHGENWRSKVDLLAWYDASWAINGRDNYTADVLDSYEAFIDVKDAYVQGSLTPNLDLKFGRQVVIWGKSDSIRITDVINPLDNREPGMVDIEDLRLSETMTRLDYYFGDWGLSGIVIHEPRLEIEAAFGSDYRPSDVFGTPISSSLFPDRQEPDWNFDNTQYAMSLDGHLRGWDISFYAAHVYDNRFDIQVLNNAPSRTVDKIDMAGVASNFVIGSWLLKAEAALIGDIDYRSTPNKNRLDALLGFDYSGIKDVVISLEVANRHIFDYEEQMLTLTLQDAAASNTFPDFARKDSVQVALRTAYSFDHDNATITYLLSLAGGNGAGANFDGGFQRLWLDYKYTDAISLSVGIVDYIGGDGIIPFFSAIEDNDRVFAEFRYDF
jgi:hypothetical protein